MAHGSLDYGVRDVRSDGVFVVTDGVVVALLYVVWIWMVNFCLMWCDVGDCCAWSSEGVIVGGSI